MKSFLLGNVSWRNDTSVAGPVNKGEKSPANYEHHCWESSDNVRAILNISEQRISKLPVITQSDETGILSSSRQRQTALGCQGLESHEWPRFFFHDADQQKYADNNR